MSSPPVFPFSRTDNLQPPPDYARLRAEAPATKVTTPHTGTPIKRTDEVRQEPAWLLTRYPLIKKVLGDDRFHIPTSEGVVDDPSLLQNPPRHTRLRRLAEKAFTPSRVAALRPFTQRAAAELVDAMIARPGPADLMTSLAMPLPIAVLSELFGVPGSEVDGLRSVADALVGYTDRGRADAPANWLALNAYISGLIETRNRQPGDDLITALIRAHDGAGDRFTQAELVSMGVTLVVAGYPKVAHTIAIGAVRLLSEGDLGALAGDAVRVGRAVEEILRLQPGRSVEGMPRLSTQDMKLDGGIDVRAGDMLIVPLEAANRDPEVFAEPDRFDPARAAAAEHLAFGYGAHRCLGEPLARLQLLAAFEALANRVPKLRLAMSVDQLPWRPIPLGEGPARVDVDW